MTKEIDAIYKDGVFRPTEPVDLVEGCSVKVIIDDSASVELDSNGNLSSDETSQTTKPDKSNQILDVFRQAWKEIPKEELESLPTDLAAEHDHYIYGTPKRSV
ncbi:MAG: hypothetical protein ETSY1_26135 [Candidatus Entotheonella factor]|uniref:DUF104 domain-containing protein n=1 Tax=Entotheonella factor TaxID=1429438 RepID=W4LFQ8_ENTF1|nr:MAG: hypothetical protein ETSY1_26135 [Candidatus Entotheonella factor]